MYIKNLKNITNKELDSIILNIGECKNFTNKIFINLLYILSIERDNQNNKESNELIQFTLINRIYILRENCINIFSSLLENKNIKYAFDSHSITMNINSFYIQISGLIDNLAWYIENRFNLLNIKIDNNKNRKKIGLNINNNKEFLNKLKEKSNTTYQLIKENQSWFNELKNKRDPIAHRRPLFVPPSTITENGMSFLPFVSFDGSILHIEEMIVNDIFRIHNLIIEIISISKDIPSSSSV